MALLRDQLLFQEDALVVRRVIKPGEFLVTEFRVEIRSLERKGVEPGRMTAEFASVALGIGQQDLTDAAATQIGMHPEQVDEQPAGVTIADQPGPDRAGTVA